MLLAAPLKAQFISADSSGSFYVVSDATNSTENTGVGASGEFLWDSSTLHLRIIVNNLAGTTGFPDNGVLTSFGFQTPALNPGTVTLDAFGEYDGGSPLSLGFTLVEDYQIFSFPEMGIGIVTPPLNSDHAGSPSDGLPETRSAFFDFNFTGAGIDPGDFSFEGFGYSPSQEGDFTIAFRFQGIGDGDNDEFSDAFGGYVVPEPSTYGTFGILALLGIISARFFRGKRKE